MAYLGFLRLGGRGGEGGITVTGPNTKYVLKNHIYGFCFYLAKYLKAGSFFPVKKYLFNCPVLSAARGQDAQFGHSLLPRDTSGQQHFLKFLLFNPLRTKFYPSDLKTQFVPRSKHSLLRL